MKKLTLLAVTLLALGSGVLLFNRPTVEPQASIEAPETMVIKESTPVTSPSTEKAVLPTASPEPTPPVNNPEPSPTTEEPAEEPAETPPVNTNNTRICSDNDGPVACN